MITQERRPTDTEQQEQENPKPREGIERPTHRQQRLAFMVMSIDPLCDDRNILLLLLHLLSTEQPFESIDLIPLFGPRSRTSPSRIIFMDVLGINFYFQINKGWSRHNQCPVSYEYEGVRMLTPNWVALCCGLGL